MSVLQRALSEYTIVQGTREDSHEKWHLPVSTLQKGIYKIFCHTQAHAVESLIGALQVSELLEGIQIEIQTEGASAVPFGCATIFMRRLWQAVQTKR